MSAISTKSALEFHPLANVFPLSDGEEFQALAADITAHGVHEPVVLYEGQILDGRNRYRASRAAGVDCPLATYVGDDPAAYVVSLNLHRRHLTESQRAMAAAKLVSWARGENQHTSGSANLPTHKAAEMLKVSERSVTTARAVRDKGTPELQQKVEHGKVSVSAAADVATLPKTEQAEIVARGGAGDIGGRAGHPRSEGCRQSRDSDSEDSRDQQGQYRTRDRDTLSGDLCRPALALRKPVNGRDKPLYRKSLPHNVA